MLKKCSWPSCTCHRFAVGSNVTAVRTIPRLRDSSQFRPHSVSSCTRVRSDDRRSTSTTHAFSIIGLGDTFLSMLSPSKRKTRQYWEQHVHEQGDTFGHTTQNLLRLDATKLVLADTILHLRQVRVQSIKYRSSRLSRATRRTGCRLKFRPKCRRTKPIID